MSNKSRYRKGLVRWERMTYDTMPKRRCDYSRPWMRGWSRLRRTMYWANLAKEFGPSMAAQDRRIREYYLVQKRYA